MQEFLQNFTHVLLFATVVCLHWSSIRCAAADAKCAGLKDMNEWLRDEVAFLRDKLDREDV